MRAALAVNVEADVLGIDKWAKALNLVNHCINPAREEVEHSVVNEQQCWIVFKQARVVMAKFNSILVAIWLDHCDGIVTFHYYALVLHQLLPG